MEMGKARNERAMWRRARGIGGIGEGGEQSKGYDGVMTSQTGTADTPGVEISSSRWSARVWCFPEGQNETRHSDGLGMTAQSCGNLIVTNLIRGS